MISKTMIFKNTNVFFQNNFFFKPCFMSFLVINKNILASVSFICYQSMKVLFALKIVQKMVKYL